MIQGRWRAAAERLRRSAVGPRPDLRGRICPRPFEHVQIDTAGRLNVCCPSWMPTPIATVHDGARLLDLWNSPMAQRVRASILDGSYRYCDTDKCPMIRAGTLPERRALARFDDEWYATGAGARLDALVRRSEAGDVDAALLLPDLPALVNLCYDESCNLSCPSCRVELIQHRKDDQRRRGLHDWVMGELLARPSARPLRLNITGSGDPFGSPLFREFLYTFDGARHPNVEIGLQTNGVMFTPKAWDAMSRLHGNVRSVRVSLDASRPETYAVVRRGGRWDVLMENLRMLAGLRRNRQITHLSIEFVTQVANYREVPDVVRLAEGLETVDRVYFARVDNWGTWAEYDAVAVWRPQHPEYPAFLRVLADAALDSPIVVLGNLSHIRQAALAAQPA